MDDSKEDFHEEDGLDIDETNHTETDTFGDGDTSMTTIYVCPFFCSSFSVSLTHPIELYVFPPLHRHIYTVRSSLLPVDLLDRS